jgi:hypothetical protein
VDEDFGTLDTLDWRLSDLALFFIVWAAMTLGLAAVIMACYWYYGD